jgi:hypothetical protein
LGPRGALREENNNDRSEGSNGNRTVFHQSFSFYLFVVGQIELPI